LKKVLPSKTITKQLVPVTLLEKSEAFIRQTLRKYLPDDSKIYLIGSRAKGSAGFASDFDICIISENLDSSLLSQLRSIFDESFVPYKVDLIDYLKTNQEFREIALEGAIEWT
jgi:uncharacterized protein